MYEIIGTKGNSTKVLAMAKTRNEAFNLWREYHHAYASDTTLAGKYDPNKDWQVNLRKKGAKQQ